MHPTRDLSVAVGKTEVASHDLPEPDRVRGVAGALCRYEACDRPRHGARGGLALGPCRQRQHEQRNRDEQETHAEHELGRRESVVALRVTGVTRVIDLVPSPRCRRS